MNIVKVRYSVINSPDESVKAAIIIIGDRDFESLLGIRIALADDLSLMVNDIELHNLVRVNEQMGVNQVIHVI